MICRNLLSPCMDSGHGLLPPLNVTQVAEQPYLPGWAYGIHCLMYLHLRSCSKTVLSASPGLRAGKCTIFSSLTQAVPCLNTKVLSRGFKLNFFLHWQLEGLKCGQSEALLRVCTASGRLVLHVLGTGSMSPIMSAHSLNFQETLRKIKPVTRVFTAMDAPNLLHSMCSPKENLRIKER